MLDLTREIWVNKKHMGRNNPIEDELMRTILNALSDANMTLKQTLITHNVSVARFFDTVTTSPLYTELYTRAQSIRADIYADQVIEIADNEVDPNTARNRMNARIWATSKMKPHVYGDRIDVNVNQTVNIIGALEEAKSRIAHAITPEYIQIAETSSTIQRDALGTEPTVDPENKSDDINYILGLDPAE